MWGEIGGILGALATVIGSLAIFNKHAADAKKVRSEIAATNQASEKATYRELLAEMKSTASENKELRLENRRQEEDITKLRRIILKRLDDGAEILREIDKQ